MVILVVLSILTAMNVQIVDWSGPIFRIFLIDMSSLIVLIALIALIILFVLIVLAVQKAATLYDYSTLYDF